MSLLFKAIRWSQYFFNSRTKYYLHSPFIYKLVSEVILATEKSPDHTIIEQLRLELSKDKTVIEHEDMGAGAYNNRYRLRSIAEMTLNMCTPSKYGNLLYRLVKHFQPNTILELGTALGIGSLYINSGLNKEAKFYSLEGCSNTIGYARRNFKTVERVIQTVKGNFDHTLEETLEDIDQLDFAYIDGNHTNKATIRYFEKCIEKVHNESVFIFDDIHWSPEMEEAWEAIKAHPQVTVSIDLLRIGIVFFRKEQAKEHFVIRF